jgi:hypothetical protein
VSLQLSDTVATMMSKQPADRFPDDRTMIEHLVDAADKAGVERFAARS